MRSKALSAVRTRSQEWIPAQNRLGLVHWRKSRVLEGRGDSAGRHGRGPEGARIAERRAQGTPRRRHRRDRSRLDRQHRATSQPCSPRSASRPRRWRCSIRSSRPKPSKSGPGYALLLEAQLKAYIVSGKVDPAIAAIKELEQAGGAAGRAQLYFKLGRLLEKEIESLQAKKNTKALANLTQSYKTILNTLVESKSGQTYESLDWAASSLLGLWTPIKTPRKCTGGCLTIIPRIPSSSSKPAARPG